MADKPKYASIIDEFLDAREPDWKDLGLKDAKSSGDEWLDRTHDLADEKFLDEIAEGASHHTNVPPTSKGATLQNRLLDKENASPRLGANSTARTRLAANDSYSEDDSLVEEVTHSLEEAAKGGKVEKKHRSDGEILRYVKQLLNQGEAPSKVASQLKKLAEIELFNHQLATRYLQDNAGLVGMAYMEPNTFMDNANPNYERKASKKASKEITPVIFRKWKDNGDIFALFPEDLGTNDPYTCSSYEHVGQHGSADPQGCIWNSKPATKEEYAALKSELEGIGYNLRPMSRLQYSAIETRKKKLKQYNESTIPPAPVEAEAGDWNPADEYDAPTDALTHQKEVQGSSNDCVRQAKAWKAAGIKPRAKSVKQITACEGCSYFKKNGSSKTCGLYGLPVVGTKQELASVVNKLTAGVPATSKRAALVQIANRMPEQHIPVKQASPEAPFVHQASFTRERQYGFVEAAHFGGAQVQKLHAAGHSLKQIVAAGEKKYGALETSKAIREFVASLRKEKGKIVMAKADAQYLKKVGIHNEAIVGAAKCASCKAHTGKEVRKAASTEMVTRAPETFVQATPQHIRATQKKVVANFDSASVAKYHAAGHSVDKIFKAASSKFGSAQASKAIRDWAHNLKNTNTKIALSQIDCTTLKKMGVKLSSQNAIVGAEKCASCSFRNGMHCGMTGGTLLSFPGMDKQSSNKKVAANAPTDGRSILKEFDLMGSSAQADIDMKAPERADIQMGQKMDAGDIE